MPLKAAHSIYLINTPPIRIRIGGVFLLSMKNPGCAGEVRKLLAMVKGLILNVSAYAEPTKDYNMGELMFPRPPSKHVVLGFRPGGAGGGALPLLNKITFRRRHRRRYIVRAFAADVRCVRLRRCQQHRPLPAYEIPPAKCRGIIIAPSALRVILNPPVSLVAIRGMCYVKYEQTF